MTTILAPVGMSWQRPLCSAGLKPTGSNTDAMSGVVGLHASATQPWAHAALVPAAAAAGVRDRRYVIRPRGTPPV